VLITPLILGRQAPRLPDARGGRFGQRPAVDAQTGGSRITTVQDGMVVENTTSQVMDVRKALWKCCSSTTR
jgi:hypothetical protein